MADNEQRDEFRERLRARIFHPGVSVAYVPERHHPIFETMDAAAEVFAEMVEGFRKTAATTGERLKTCPAHPGHAPFLAVYGCPWCGFTKLAAENSRLARELAGAELAVERLASGAPVTPDTGQREPRVWRKGDPSPADVNMVRDNLGREWCPEVEHQIYGEPAWHMRYTGHVRAWSEILDDVDELVEVLPPAKAPAAGEHWQVQDYDGSGYCRPDCPACATEAPAASEQGECVNCQHGAYHHREGSCYGVCGIYTPRPAASEQPATQAPAASEQSTPTEAARHIAELTAALKRIDWQGGTDYGSQWLAGKLYDDGIRVQLPPYQEDPAPEPIRSTGRQGRGA